MPKQDKDSSAKAPRRQPSTEAVARFDQWRRRAGTIQADAMMHIMADPLLRSALHKTFAHADYLAKCCLAHPDAAIEALLGEPAKVLSEVARDLRALDRATGPTSSLSSAVKPLKERAIVAIGLADLCEKWPQEKIGASLSDLAERILDAGLSWFTRLAYRHGEFTSQEELAPIPLPGMFILGSGDLAADEPSFCGPLEIALIYDPDILKKQGIGASERAFVRIAGEMADAFGALNKDGTIFELHHYGFVMAKQVKATDQSVLALTVPDLNKQLVQKADPRDRAWFATARVVAGDRTAGGEFVEKIGRKLWKKGFSADDIRSAITPPGAQDTDPVLGFSQAHARLVRTCQLALGQQHEEFRRAPGRTVFETAARIGALDELAAKRLGSNYQFNMMARNRLQLRRGQALTKPETESDIVAQALLCDYTEPELFEGVLKGAVSEADQHWLNITSDRDNHGFDILGGSAAEGASSDAATKDAGRLEEIGFGDGRDIASTVDQWLKGNYAGTSSEPKQRLSQLAPGLLTEFAATQDPDQAIANFDRLLTHLPSEEKPFDRLREEPELANSVIDILGNTSQLGRLIASNAELIREIFAETVDMPATAQEWLAKYPMPRRHGPEQQVFDTLNEWLWENRGRLCLAWIKGALALEQTGEILSGLADAVLCEVYDVCFASVKEKEKSIGNNFAAIAMGQYGGGWIAMDTPLEIVFVYNPKTKEGADPEAVRQFTELAASITEQLTKPRPIPDFGDLPLFEVDLRRRPGGTSGEMASSVGVYANYYIGEASARDQLALMRARVVCGAEKLTVRIEDAISDIVTRPRQANQVMRDIDRARSKEVRLDRSESIWEIQRIPGGLGDLDLIAQCLQLMHGPEHPYVFTTDIREAVAALGRAGCLESTIGSELSESLAYWQRLRAIQAFTGVYDPTSERPRKRLANLLARAAGVSDYSAVEPLIRGHAERTVAHYNALILGQEPGSTMSRAATAR